VHGSDEEIDDQPEVGSDEEDFSDEDKHAHEEVDLCFYLSLVNLILEEFQNLLGFL